MLIIILAFVPVFTLIGEEGKLFHPLAFAKTFAMIGATLLAVTVVPALCTFLVRGPFRREEDNWMMKRLLRDLRSGVGLGAGASARGAGRRGGLAGAGACPRLRPAPACGRALESWGGTARRGWRRAWAASSCRTLNEGSLLFMPVLLPSTSLTEIKRLIAWQDQRHEAGARSPVRRRQTRPLRNRHRPGAGRDDRNHHRAQAGIGVAAGHDPGEADRGIDRETEPGARATCPVSCIRSKAAS